jgi:hypothetical protein
MVMVIVRLLLGENRRLRGWQQVRKTERLAAHLNALRPLRTFFSTIGIAATGILWLGE